MVEPAQRRRTRHAARAAQVYRRFLARVQDLSGLDAAGAEQVATAVLCALERRIAAGERDHLEAQLPSLLRERVQRGCAGHAEVRPRQVDRRRFLERVAEHDLAGGDAESAARVVFQVLSELVSAGEIVAVVHQLPRGMRDLWPPAVQEAARSAEELDREAQLHPELALELDVEPRLEHRGAERLRDRILALPLEDQLELLRQVLLPLGRELGRVRRLELVRELLDDSAWMRPVPAPPPY